MRKFIVLSVICVVLLMVVSVVASTEQIRLRNRTISEFSFKLDKLGITHYPCHLIMKVNRPLELHEIKQLEDSGIRFHDYIPKNGWYVTVSSDATIKQLSSHTLIEGFAVILPGDKLSPFLRNQGVPFWARTGDDTFIFSLTFYSDVSLENATSIVEDHGGELTLWETYDIAQRLEASLSLDSISALAQVDDVYYIEEAPRPIELHNRRAALIAGVTAVQSPPYNLTGEGVTVGVLDGGTACAHTDFADRLIIGDDIGYSDHPTHICGTIGGDGSGNNSAKGMATECQLVSFGTSPFAGKLRRASRDYNVTIANNSWGLSDGWSGYYGSWTWMGTSGFGWYSSLSREADKAIIDYNMFVVFSAGNDGGEWTSGEYYIPGQPGTYSTPHPPDGPYHSIGSYACAKNVISVGAVDDNSYMTTFSSSGPCDDGRVKPDVVENGTDLFSTICPNNYGRATGTSMSGPVVCGIAALYTQAYMLKNNGDMPSSSLLKALTIWSAAQQPPTVNHLGPNYRSGFGVPKAIKGVDLIFNDYNESFNNRHYFYEDWINQASGEVHEYYMYQPNDDYRINVVLYWHDAPGAMTSTQALRNDLDLELISPKGYPYYPFINDKYFVDAPPRYGVNNTDNIEQCVIGAPDVGVWTIKVKGTSLNAPPQKYSLVCINPMARTPTPTEPPITPYPTITPTYTPTATPTQYFGDTYLSWAGDPELNVTYTVFLGTDYMCPVNPIAINIKETYVHAGRLAENTTYYWRVMVRSDEDKWSDSQVPWHFTTGDRPYRTDTPTPTATITPIPPDIAIAGYMDTYLDSSGGNLSVLALVQNEEGIPVDKVEILYQGVPTGLELFPQSQHATQKQDKGIQSTVFTLYTYIPPGAAPISIPLELLATDELGGNGDLWPYLVVDDGGSSTSSEKKELPNYIHREREKDSTERPKDRWPLPPSNPWPARGAVNVNPN